MRWLTVSLLTFTIAVGATLITNDTSGISASTFEYIIVGGGTTGLAVANRLAANHSVLVIERGTDERDNEGINNPTSTNGIPPANVTCKVTQLSAPQLGSNGTNVRTLTVQYGNCLGGGSSVNTMIGSRPTVAGMNAVEALGNPGWGWEDFLPLMQRSETFTPPTAEQMAAGASFNKSVHGTDGPVGVSFADPLIATGVQNAAKNASDSVYGLALTQDMGDGFSGGHQASGYHHIHFNSTLQKQRRSSSAWSFLYPQEQDRSNLIVLTGHTVDTILHTTDSSGNLTATGVSLVPTAGGGSSIQFNVTREVVVSAGAPFSPGVLLRSGIGNSTFLQSLGITPALDLPGVGSNFQDQTLLVNISFPLSDSAKSNPNVSTQRVMLGAVVAHATADNSFGGNSTDMIVSRIRDAGSENATAPVVQKGGVINQQSLQLQANVTANAFEQDHPLIELFFTPGQTTLSLWSQSVLPISRGTIKINTTDPLAFPVVDAQYLTSDVDIDIFTRASKRLALVAASEPFKALLAPNASAVVGLPSLNATDDVWKTWTLDHYGPGVHFVGSNSMMPKEMGGVVSPQLLVYGTTNLRIADASIMPLSVFPHCTLGLYGVAEKAADMILQTAETTPPLTSPTTSGGTSSSGSPPAPSGSNAPSSAVLSWKVPAAGMVAAGVSVLALLH